MENAAPSSSPIAELVARARAAQRIYDAFDFTLAEGEAEMPDAQAAQKLTPDLALPGVFVRREADSAYVVRLKGGEDRCAGVPGGDEPGVDASA